MGEYQGGLAYVGDYVCHSKCLAAAGNAKKDLCGYSVQDALGELPYCFGLVSCGSVICCELEIHSGLIAVCEAKLRQ